MNSFITQQTLSVGPRPPRPRGPFEIAARDRSSGSARKALGVALMTIGRRIAGEMPAGTSGRPEGGRA